MAITGFVVVTFIIYFCHWSSKRGTRRTNTSGTHNRSVEQPTVPVLHTRTAPCATEDVEQGTRVRTRPLAPLALGSLYPVPRRPPYPEILNIINSNNNANTNVAIVNMDAPPSYDEAVKQSPVTPVAPSVPLVNTISGSIVPRVTSPSAEDKERH